MFGKMGRMPPPELFVMSTGATGPPGDRRPAGVIHAVRRALPPSHTTLCGQANALYLFSRVAFDSIEHGRCPLCAGLAARPRGQG